MIEIAQTCRCGKVTKLPLLGEPVTCTCGWRLRLRIVVWAEPPMASEAMGGAVAAPHDEAAREGAPDAR
jgi:hypothetical protein